MIVRHKTLTLSLLMALAFALTAAPDGGGAAHAACGPTETPTLGGGCLPFHVKCPEGKIANSTGQCVKLECAIGAPNCSEKGPNPSLHLQVLRCGSQICRQGQVCATTKSGPRCVYPAPH